ncbi:MAG TPA: GntR family transcriptional regulator [Alphaproteobacteria bacterium]|nr:GntR family transcriptional regulator [Alphaproteobacteria bacterium]
MTDQSPSNAITRSNLRPRKASGDAAVYAQLYDAILEQRLAPGTKLPEDGLGEIFGVSRTVVRKALFRLAHEELIRFRPNRGAIVASPTVEEAAQVFEARRVVEGAIVRKVFARVTAESLRGLKNIVSEERAAHERGDRAGWIRLSGEFHLRLADIAGNRVLADYLKALVSRTSLIISLYERPGNSACAFDEHASFLIAVEANDLKRALVLMERHLEACEAKLNTEEQTLSRDLAAIFGENAEARNGQDASGAAGR